MQAKLIIRPATRKENKPRRQHIIPQMHLRRFASAKGQVCVFTKGGAPRWTSIVNTAVERDYNEFDLGATKTDYSVEALFGVIEGNAAPIVDEMLSGRQLSLTQVQCWATYVASLFLRTRKVRYQLSAKMGEALFEEYSASDFALRDMQHELLKEGALVPLETLRSVAVRQVSRMTDQPAFLHLNGFDGSTINLANHIIGKLWHIVRAPRGKILISSDCPVTSAKIDAGALYPGFGFGQPLTTVFLALTPEDLFVAAPPEQRWQSELSDSDVDLINRVTARYGEREIYSSECRAEFQTLADEHLNLIEFGRDAYRS